MSLNRDQLVKELQLDLVGPSGDEAEVLLRSPLRTYLCGAVYPKNFRPMDGEVDDSDDPLELTSKFYPSAVGLSAIAKVGSQLVARAGFSRYVGPSAEGQWTRKRESLTLTVDSVEGGNRQQVEIDGVELMLETRSEIAGSGLIQLTAMLVNRNQSAEQSSDELGSQQTVFQAQIELVASVPFDSMEGTGALEREETSRLGDEEEDLRFLYRSASSLAHGHGVAVSWDMSHKRIWTETVPTALVHSLRADGDQFSQESLSLEQLARGEGRSLALNEIVAGYEAWTARLSERLKKISASDPSHAATQRILVRQSECLARMKSGLARLEDDQVSSEAWTLGVLTMKRLFERRAKLDLPNGSDFTASVPTARFRAFQVAFALLILPGLGDATTADDTRDMVDLLWFPTGGGKTEAYLFIALMEIFSRRLRNPRERATVVLSRYTYRMLAFDQFSRAAGAMCAAEIVRLEHPELKEGHPITIGLWIGDNQTPNRLKAIDTPVPNERRAWRDRWSDRTEASDGIAFPVVSCPWCRTELEFGRSFLRVSEADADMRIYCPSSKCEFSQSQSGAGLPIAVVDEHLYASCPAMVIATVDKLAMVATWDPSNGPNLLAGADVDSEGISLLVFDELHLLSGPLGTLAALNEIAIEAIIRSGASGHRRPKVIASTATIRTADAQVKSLLGRALRTFPVSGDDPDDSYWATRDDRPETARLYCGTITSGSTWQALYVYAQSSLMAHAAELPSAAQDPYWTSVVYTQTLREHGRAVGLLVDDVRNRLRQNARLDEKGQPLESRQVLNVRELRGDKIGGRLPVELERLRIRHDPTRLGSPDEVRRLDRLPVDAVVTTNLIQVGVDVPRLGLMIFLGQPKGTAEYIQASSRVGRSPSAPGLILTLFQHTKPRDRSHYETFHSYHQALYRAVEPISITPFAKPALERSARSVLAAVGRHGIDRSFGRSEGAGMVGSNEDALGVLARSFMGAVAARGAVNQDEISSFVDVLLGQWKARSKTMRTLTWSERTGQIARLLRQRFDASSVDAWPYDTSLRSVEPDIAVKLDGNFTPSHSKANQP